jgi:cation diffusion facilitator family transporter
MIPYFSSSAGAMRLSLIVGFVMLVLKVGAYLLTGSAAILGDAAESIVHVVAVTFAAYSLALVDKPADDDHRYGHGKVEFFSAGVEGGLIVLAAVFIIYQSILKWAEHHEPGNLDSGVLLIVLTIVINGVLGAYLIRTGKRGSSLILISNGHHVLTDCWTSLGSLVGLGLMHLTGWHGWDPVCGLLMAANIIVSGYALVSRSVHGLMDVADPELARDLDSSLAAATAKHGVTFHALRHRDSGSIHWVDVHLLFPVDISLRDAHRTATEIEAEVRASVTKRVVITSHLECADDHDALHPDETITG